MDRSPSVPLYYLCKCSSIYRTKVLKPHPLLLTVSPYLMSDRSVFSFRLSAALLPRPGYLCTIDGFALLFWVSRKAGKFHLGVGCAFGGTPRIFARLVKADEFDAWMLPEPVDQHVSGALGEQSRSMGGWFPDRPATCCRSCHSAGQNHRHPGLLACGWVEPPLVSRAAKAFRRSWAVRLGQAGVPLLARSKPGQPPLRGLSNYGCVGHEHQAFRESALQRFAGRTADSDSESAACVNSGERSVHSRADRQANKGSNYEDVEKSDGRRGHSAVRPVERAETHSNTPSTLTS